MKYYNVNEPFINTRQSEYKIHVHDMNTLIVWWSDLVYIGILDEESKSLTWSGNCASFCSILSDLEIRKTLHGLFKQEIYWKSQKKKSILIKFKKIETYFNT